MASRNDGRGPPDRIALIRVHLGLPQGAFAARIGICRNSVIAYERGHTVPRASTVRRIAAAGGVTVEALREGPAPHWLQDGSWADAIALLRVVWGEPARRAKAMALLRSLKPQ